MRLPGSGHDFPGVCRTQSRAPACSRCPLRVRGLAAQGSLASRLQRSPGASERERARVSLARTRLGFSWPFPLAGLTRGLCLAAMSFLRGSLDTRWPPPAPRHGAPANPGCLQKRSPSVRRQRGPSSHQQGPEVTRGAAVCECGLERGARAGAAKGHRGVHGDPPKIHELLFPLRVQGDCESGGARCARGARAAQGSLGGGRWAAWFPSRALAPAWAGAETLPVRAGRWADEEGKRPVSRAGLHGTGPGPQPGVPAARGWRPERRRLGGGRADAQGRGERGARRFAAAGPPPAARPPAPPPVPPLGPDPRPRRSGSRRARAGGIRSARAGGEDPARCRGARVGWGLGPRRSERESKRGRERASGAARSEGSSRSAGARGSVRPGSWRRGRRGARGARLGTARRGSARRGEAPLGTGHSARA